MNSSSFQIIKILKFKSFTNICVIKIRDRIYEILNRWKAIYHLSIAEKYFFIFSHFLCQTEFDWKRKRYSPRLSREFSSISTWGYALINPSEKMFPWLSVEKFRQRLLMDAYLFFKFLSGISYYCCSLLNLRRNFAFEIHFLFFPTFFCALISLS